MKRFAAAIAATLALAAWGQGYPHRPVTITVPFAAGGPTDTIARIMAERMSRTLGQPVVVENTVGAGGTIAVTKILRAAPDGYSVGIGHVGTHVIAPAVQQVTTDYLAELEPVGMMATNPQIIVSTGMRFGGAVSIVLMSFAPISERYSVRGIGVAESVSISTSRKSSLKRSLCSTPNRCSSSMTTSPKSLKCTSREINRCVPITISTLPSRTPSSVFRCCPGVRNRESMSTVIG